MDTFPNFNEYLDGACNQSEQIRKQAELSIGQAKEADTTKFICSLIKELCDESNSAGCRQMASVVFKNTLINATQQEDGDNLWFKMTEEMRGHIKDALLQMLQSENRDTLKNASICLGIIAAVEVPDGAWDHFMTTMTENSTSDNYQYRLASVQTLGFLSEFLDTYVDKQLNQDQIGQILHATICNINATQIELTQIAIKALQRTMSSTSQNFLNKEQRDFIMDGIFCAIAIPDEQIQQDALQALQEVPMIAYQVLGDYILRVGEMTHKFMTENDSQNTKASLQFWIHLCQAEMNSVKTGCSMNIVAQYKDSLLQIIFNGIAVTELEDDEHEVEDSIDDIQYTVSRASASLLIEVAALLGDQVLSQTIQFASGLLNGQTWQENFVGMLALGSVMDGPQAESISNELTPAYVTIFHMLSNSTSSRVRSATAGLIAQMVKHSPQLVFANNDHLKLLMEQGMNHIEKDHIQIKYKIAQAWSSAFEESANLGSNFLTLLNPYFAPCINAMLTCLFSLDTLPSGTLMSFTNSVTMMIEKCDHMSLKAELYACLENMYQKIVAFMSDQQLQSGLNLEQKEVLMNNWCGCLQPSLVRVGKEGINDQMMSMFVDLSIQSCQMFNKVMTGALFILQGLIFTLDERIQSELPKFISYLTCGLRRENCDAMGTRNAAGIISDLSNSIGAGISQWLPEIMPLLQQVLTDPNFDSESKLFTIIAFGDLALAAGPQEFMQYLPETQSSFVSASQMSLSKGEGPDEADLFSRLRIALVDAYISILHGLVPDDISPQMTAVQGQQAEGFALQMFQYLEALVANKELAFPTELLKPMYDLYIDLSTMYVTRGENILNTGRGSYAMHQNSPVFQRFLDSNLADEMVPALQALPIDDRQEVEQRFYEAKHNRDRMKEKVAPGAPGMAM